MEIEIEKIPPSWMSYASFIADIGQIFFFIITIVASFYAFVYRKKIFRTELQKYQFRDLVEIRRQLQEMVFDLAYLPSIRDTMETMKWNIDELKIESFDEWSKYMRYMANSNNLYDKFQSPENYMFPKWTGRTEVQKIYDAMGRFHPFTIISSTNHTEAEIREYNRVIFFMISYLSRKLATA